MLRVSTTALESFRLFLEPDQEWMTEDALLASIRGEGVVETVELVIGQAFDRILEKPEKYRTTNGYFYPVKTEAAPGIDGFFFGDAVMTPALALFVGPGVWQVRGTKQYGEALVVAKADRVRGAEIIDNKTTFSSIDVEKYLASCQWRFYLDMFGGLFFTYNVFQLGEDRKTLELVLKDVATFRAYPYALMHQDCLDLVTRFVAYVRSKPGLAELLEQKQREAEARAVLV